MTMNESKNDRDEGGAGQMRLEMIFLSVSDFGSGCKIV